MITDIDGAALKVGQVVLDIFFDAVAEIIDVLEEGYIVVKYLEDGFFNANDVMKIKAIEVKVIYNN